MIDHLVLTAANAAQARGYRAQLRAREKTGRLAGVGAWHVLADPSGRRVGSGGATVLALDSLRAEIQHRTIVVLHSGGDSRRLPAYAALGKSFIPLPLRSAEGRPLALFDLILADLLACAGTLDGPRTLIASGDVYLGVGRQGLNLAGEGVVAVGFRAPYTIAKAHGVFIVNAKGQARDVLQKPSRAEARSRGALDPQGRALVDSGLLSFSPRAAAALLRAAPPRRFASNTGPVLDLYEHVMMAMTPRTRGAPLRAKLPDAALAAGLATHLAGLPLDVRTAPRCEFLHVGTTRQMLGLAPRLRRFPGFVQGPTPPRSNSLVFNSTLPALAPALGPGSIVESSVLARCNLPGHNLVVGWLGGPLRLPRGIGVSCLPIGTTAWAVVAFGDADDAKTPAPAGGTFLNQPLPAWPGLWRRGEAPTLWTARLWHVGPLAAATLATQRLIEGREPRPLLSRLSLAALMGRVNHARLQRSRAALEHAAITRDFAALVRQDQMSAPHALSLVREGADRHRLQSLAIRAARAGGPATTARRWWLAARLADQSGSAPVLESRAFAAIARAASWHGQPSHTQPPACAVPPGAQIRATCPVRIDLAGGWSDTPPICNDLGGSVVNVAITLDARRPIEVFCRPSATPGLHVTSVDLGKRLSMHDAGEVHDYAQHLGWASLAKAALALSGFAPGPRGSLAPWLRAFGGGVELTCRSAVPKGSGLGASSILGATVLAALARLKGEPLTTPALIERTSRLEQAITTGGGWQDQVGGIVGGVKLSTTRPGERQIPTITRIPGAGGLTRPDIQDRLVLFNTGRRRLAKNLLRSVVGRYLDQGPRVLSIIDELKAGAIQMHDAMRRADIDAIAHQVNRYWDLKRELDPGSCPAFVSSLEELARPYASACLLPGAGAGGFLFVIARSAAAARALRRRLQDAPAPPGSGLAGIAVDQDGLRVDLEPGNP